SRIVWGRRADRSGGTRRLQALRDTGLMATVAAVAIPVMLAWGAWAALPATVVLAFGVFGFNGVLYLVAGEIAGPERAGRAVGLADLDTAGGRILELLQYHSPPGTALRQTTRDPGSAHIALTVDDVDATLSRLAGAGVQPLSTRPVTIEAPGSSWHGCRCVYL